MHPNLGRGGGGDLGVKSGCQDAHVKSVKYTGLVSFGHSLDLFVQFYSNIKQ